MPGDIDVIMMYFVHSPSCSLSQPRWNRTSSSVTGHSASVDSTLKFVCRRGYSRVLLLHTDEETLLSYPFVTIFIYNLGLQSAYFRRRTNRNYFPLLTSLVHV